MKYYPIDETLARRAKEMNSHFGYVEGSATEEYRRAVDRAASIAEQQKQKGYCGSNRSCILGSLANKSFTFLALTAYGQGQTYFFSHHFFSFLFFLLQRDFPMQA